MDGIVRELFRSCRPFQAEFYTLNGPADLIEGEDRRLSWETMPFERVRVRAFSAHSSTPGLSPTELSILQHDFRNEELRRAREAYFSGWILELLNPLCPPSRQGEHRLPMLCR